MHAQAAEHAGDELRLAGAEEDRRAGLGRERGELLLGEELRDRRAALAVLVDDDVGEALCPPLLRNLLEPRQLGARERLAARRSSARRARREKTPNSEPRVTSVASWISMP